MKAPPGFRHPLLCLLALPLIFSATLPERKAHAMEAATPKSAPVVSDLPAFIDAQIAAKAALAGVPLAPPAEDAEFLRRVWLDLAGTIPSATETRAFLADKAQGKRAALIDKLIQSKEFARRMGEALHIQLMERSGDDPKWLAFLTEAIEQDRPWNEVVRDILAPDFKDEKKSAAAYFVTKRLDKVGSQQTDYPGLTRDIGRMFLGVDLQCGQCHNHLTVADYKQLEFNGLFMAVQNLKLNEPKGELKTKWLSEGLLESKYEFTSVLSGAKSQTGPRVPFGAEIAIPELKGDDAWLVAPDKKAKTDGVPKFSPMRSVAETLTAPENSHFARNIANRLWWQFMGRGLVDPLDLHHSGNPASHPELLERLGTDMKARGFDLRWMVRQLVASETYQRSGRLPHGSAQPEESLFAVALEKPVCAEQFMRSFLRAAGEWERVGEGSSWEGLTDKRLLLKDVQTGFKNAFANAPKEPELRANPSLRGALFLRNNDTVLWALQPRTGNLLERISRISEPAEVAAELFLSVFCRLPEKDEQADLLALLKASADKTKTLSQVLWAMTASMEFFTNH